MLTNASPLSSLLPARQRILNRAPKAPSSRFLGVPAAPRTRGPTWMHRKKGQKKGQSVHTCRPPKLPSLCTAFQLVYADLAARAPRGESFPIKTAFDEKNGALSFLSPPPQAPSKHLRHACAVWCMSAPSWATSVSPSCRIKSPSARRTKRLRQTARCPTKSRLPACKNSVPNSPATSPSCWPETRPWRSETKERGFSPPASGGCAGPVLEDVAEQGLAGSAGQDHQIHLRSLRDRGTRRQLQPRLSGDAATVVGHHGEVCVAEPGCPGSVFLSRKPGRADIDLLDDPFDDDAVGNDLKDPVVAAEH